MDKPNKKVILITLSTVALIVAVVAAFRYLPLNRIMSIGKGKDAGYTAQAQAPSRAPNSLYFGFEPIPAMTDNNGLYKGVAHSGNYSAKVFGKNTFSTPIITKVSEIGTSNLDAVGLSSWVYIFPTTNEITGALVFVVNNALGVNITWKGISVSGKDLPMGKWFKISGLFNLDGLKLEPDYKIQIYFWNNSSSDILVDDFYAVFGGEKPRKGDSTLVDMTRGTAFLPKFNYPPFPVNWLWKQEINNNNSSFIVKTPEVSIGDITPSDKTFAGNFSAGNDGRDDILVFRQNGMVEIYRFCQENEAFTRIGVNLPPGMDKAFASGKIISGRFTGPSASQLLILTGQELILCGFDPVKQPCASGNKASTSCKVIWKTPLQKAGITDAEKIVAADADGDRITELFIPGSDGTWKLMKINTSATDPLRVIATGKEIAAPDWNPGNRVEKIIPGKFSTRFDQDLLLTVFSAADSKNLSYSLRRFDAGSGRFVPVCNGRKSSEGMTVGLDTLHPGDRFFTGVFDNSGKTKVLRYCREWRYDLKEISFSDTTFRIISGLDFKGYENDHNPKYFDVLEIIPGRFIDPGRQTLMIIGRNCKTWDAGKNACSEYRDLPFLPNTLQFYSFWNEKKN